MHSAPVTPHEVTFPEVIKEVSPAFVDIYNQVSQCISRYIDDVNVKECAKRAAWLGNDETHYTRRWDDRDIIDLKLLVRLTVNWIENVILTQKYIAEMADGRT